MLFIFSSHYGPKTVVSVGGGQWGSQQTSRDRILKDAIPGELLLRTRWRSLHTSRRRSLHTSRQVRFMSLCATRDLMKYINAHIPQRHALLLLLVLILLPAWTHEQRKWRGVFERKTGVPMGIPQKERKETERREDGSAGRGGGCSGWRQTVSRRQGEEEWILIISYVGK